MKRKQLLVALLAMAASMGLASCRIQPSTSSSSTPQPSSSQPSSSQPSTSSSVESTSSSTEVGDQITHQSAFVRDVAEGASLRTFNELFDKMKIDEENPEYFEIHFHFNHDDYTETDKEEFIEKIQNIL